MLGVSPEGRGREASRPVLPVEASGPSHRVWDVGMLRCLGDSWEGPTLASLRGIQEGFVGGWLFVFLKSR